jgi:ABC-type uncharacterized transport system YnjBCD ATPase subunit
MRTAEISAAGQTHRVALGPLLLARCETLLLDELYTGLDVSLRRTLTGLGRAKKAEAMAGRWACRTDSVQSETDLIRPTPAHDLH